MSSNSTDNQGGGVQKLIRNDDQKSAEQECDLCGGPHFEVIATFDRHGQSLGTGICVHCGLVAHIHRPTNEELAEFYATQYRQEYHGETVPSSRRIMRAWKNGQRILSQVGPFLKSDDRVFEVGAGIGCTVKLFEQQGFETSGIEPHEGFQSFSGNRLHTKVTQASLFDLAREPTYDCILLVHVIEHFHSPRQALEHIHGLLKPGGRLYVECPNLEAPFTRQSQLFHFAHIHNFTPVSLAMLARRCGFIVEEQFGRDDDPNLQMLLTRVDEVDLKIDSDNYRRTLRSLRKYNLLTYHMRWHYLYSRLKQVVGYISEYLSAGPYTKQILKQCAVSGQDQAKSAAIDELSENIDRQKAA